LEAKASAAGRSLLGHALRATLDQPGIVSVIVGVLLIVMPGPGLLSIVWLVAVWSIATGILRILFAFKARKFVDNATAKLASLGS